MLCPFCHHADTRVIDSRLANEGEQVRRRRACGGCGERFTTYESAVDLALPRVVKRDASREQFSADKLRGSFMRALEKRPVETEAIDDALERIKRRLRAEGEREIDARRIGEWAMAELRHLDQVAYIRFASVYREFEDVAAFREEIERLEREPAADGASVHRQQLPLPGVEVNG